MTDADLLRAKLEMETDEPVRTFRRDQHTVIDRKRLAIETSLNQVRFLLARKDLTINERQSIERAIALLEVA